MTIRLPFLLIAVILTAYSVAASASAAAPSPSESEANSTNDFIRTSCNTTLYPELCYRSLSGHANAIQEDPARLARVAVGVSLFRAKRLAVHVANLSRQVDYEADPRAASALHDCFTLFGDAVDQMRGSLKQMRQLTGGGEELRFEMSNVQTWMSAALTNEDTCTDGFEDVADGPVKDDVCDRTAKVKELTSNALALVNSYVAKNAEKLVP